MHPLTCHCPRCRAAQETAYEALEFEGEGILGEDEEMELAMELLHAEGEEELEQFLGSLVRTVGRGLKSVGSFAAKNVLPVLGPALKQIAKAALPLAGGALGTLIPIPGVGTALGRMAGSAIASALEAETVGFEYEAAATERARRIVRLAASAIRHAATAPAGTPDAIARAALVAAARQHLPMAAGTLARIGPPTFRSGAVWASAGTWRRRGNRIVIDGL